MIIGKVLGNVWATKKDPKLGGHKLLVIRTAGGAEGSETIVAVDTIGAGRGEDVLVTKGSVARNSLGDRDSPIDAVVVGIIDSLEVDADLLAAPEAASCPAQGPAQIDPDKTSQEKTSQEKAGQEKPSPEKTGPDKRASEKSAPNQASKDGRPKRP